jgi:hypothetical protein
MNGSEDCLTITQTWVARAAVACMYRRGYSPEPPHAPGLWNNQSTFLIQSLVEH